MRRAVNRRSICVVGVTVALLAALLVEAPGAAPLLAYEASEETFPSGDGTMLHADVFRPTDPPKKSPVILIVSPYRILASPTGNPALLYRELEDFGRASTRGYTIVQVSPRGYGESEGCGDFGGPGEQMDAVAAVEWAASQEWSNGKVGMYGLSYDAWTQIMAMAGKAKGLETAIVGSPLISAYRGLYMNGIHYAEGWHATPGLYAGIDIASLGTPNEDSATCYPQNAIGTAGDDPSVDYWRERDLIKKASRSKVPVFWTHGFLDPQTKPDNLLDVYSSLPQPKRAWFGQYVHRVPDDPSLNHEGFIDQAMAWFDYHLNGGPKPKDMKVEVQQGDNGYWRTERVWPPPDAKMRKLRFKPGEYEDSYLDDDGPDAERGTWSFTQKLPYDVHISGEMAVDALVDAARSPVHLHVRVFDLSGNSAKMVARGAALVRGETPGAPIAEQRVRFSLYPQDWRVRKGHRLGILITGADNNWFDPGVTGAAVNVTGVLKVPFLRFERDRFIDLDPSTDMANAETMTVNGTLVKERTQRVALPPRLK